MTKLVAFGDSIFAGWDGKENVQANQRIPELIGQQLGWQVANVAISGTKYDSSSNGFTAMVKKTDVSDCDYALVSYGVNNYSWPDPLAVVRQNAVEGFEALKAKNPNLRILLELPTEDFRQGSKTLYDMNSAFWNQNQLDDMLIEVANQEGLDYYDWRPNPIITYENANQTLGDGNTGVHPTPETMKAIAKVLAAKFQEMGSPSNDSSEPDTTTPASPASPTASKPTVKLIDNLKLNPITDIFGIGTNVSNEANKAIKKVNELYQTLAPLTGIEQVTVDKVSASPGNSLVRLLRNYVLESFDYLEMELNELIQICNTHWIVDSKTGKEIPTINLTRPDKLVLDSDYLSVINHNWQAIETVINQIITSLNQMLKEES